MLYINDCKLIKILLKMKSRRRNTTYIEYLQQEEECRKKATLKMPKRTPHLVIYSQAIRPL